MSGCMQTVSFTWRPLLRTFSCNIASYNRDLVVPVSWVAELKARLPLDLVGLIQIHLAEMYDRAFMALLREDITLVYEHLINACPCIRRNAIYELLLSLKKAPLVRLNLESNWPRMVYVLDEKMSEMMQVVPQHNGKYQTRRVERLYRAWRICVRGVVINETSIL